MPNVKQLTLETLPEVARGTVQTAFDRLVAAAIADCIDRPAEKKPRKVTLAIAFSPIPELIGNEYFADRAACKIAVKPSFPEMATGVLDFSIQNRAGRAEALFAPDSPESVDQATMFDTANADDETPMEPTDPD